MTFKTLSATIMTATLAAGAAPGAFAQSQGSTAGSVPQLQGGMETQVQDSQSQPMTTGNQAAADNYGALIAGLEDGTNTPATWPDQIARIGSSAKVDIIPLSRLKAQEGASTKALEQAVADDAGQMTKARGAIESNKTLKVALEDKDYTANDVVALQVDGSSDVTLVVDDQG